MHKLRSIAWRGQRMRPLAGRMAFAFAASAGVAFSVNAIAAIGPIAHAARSAQWLPRYLERPAVPQHHSAAKHSSNPPSAAHVVTNCADSGNGSLRATVATALSGDTVDLSQLACSTISLTSGAITVGQATLYLNGPGAGALTIDGSGQDRVFRHLGVGTLDIAGLSIVNGKYHSGGSAFGGGCLYSSGSIALANSTVSGCVAIGPSGSNAFGGGIYTRGGLSLVDSTLASNLVYSANQFAFGGGAYVIGDFQAKYSTISDNRADVGSGFGAEGGGLWADSNIVLRGSTFSGNQAQYSGAFESPSGPGNATISIVNSTISGNSAAVFRPGVSAGKAMSISNSTIAFNRGGESFGALYTNGPTLDLQSTIVADNITGGAANDLDVRNTTVTGARNLITSSNVPVPADTISVCPLLGPLADNGGAAMTHALSHASAAIDSGNNTVPLNFDNRGSGFPRVFGLQADIGAFEWQGGTDDRIFISGFEPVCDQ